MDRRCFLIPQVARIGLLLLPLAGFWVAAAAQEAASLVDPSALRVCADPAAMPNSNSNGEGFENKIADLLAADLGVPVQYEFFPQATGFVRNTLRAGKCDVIVGYPQGDDEVLTTNPYYRSSWALVTKQGNPLNAVKSFDDAQLQNKRIGLQIGAPPGNSMALHGLMGHVKPYGLMEDRRYSSAPEAMLADLKSGEIDAGILWGPLASYFAKRAGVDVQVTPLLAETKGPPLSFYIAMGVRPKDQDWKRKLSALLVKHKADIDKILVSYGVPVLDEQDRPVAQ